MAALTQNRKHSFTLEGEISIDLHKEHKSTSKGSGSSLIARNADE